MTLDTFVLSRVQLKQFRSIASADVALGRLLFLVGPNGSGKSNFLDALRLLSDSLQTSLDQALRARGGIGEVRRRSTGHPTHLAVEVDFEGDGFRGSYGFEVAAVRGAGFRVSRERCAIDFDPKPGVDLGRSAHFAVKDGLLTSHSESVMPPVNDHRLYLVASAGIDSFRPVFDGLAGISVFSVNPDVIRRPQTPDSGEFLLRDGANLASVLHRLERSKAARGDSTRIEDYLRLIVPGMQGVKRVELGSWETLEFSQDVPGAEHPWRFRAQSVSDGTLRALGVLVSLFASTGNTRSPIGIEEPESALHPAAAGVLLDALRDASERRQVIVTSHSPDLLDRRDIEFGEIYAVRSVGGETVIGELDEAGAFALREQLFTPGELLRTDQLLPRVSARSASEEP